LSGPNSFYTPTDFLATACSSASDKLPAPGISRSITYWGMVASPNSDRSRFFTQRCTPRCRCKTPQMGPLQDDAALGKLERQRVFRMTACSWADDGQL